MMVSISHATHVGFHLSLMNTNTFTRGFHGEREHRKAYPSGIGIKSSCRFDTVYDLYTSKEKPHYSLFAGHVSSFTKLRGNETDYDYTIPILVDYNDASRSGQSMVSSEIDLNLNVPPNI